MAALNGEIAIATSEEVFAEFPPVALRPELLGRNAVPRYDPDVVVNSIVTTGTTPTPIIAVPTPLGVSRAFTVRVSCGEIEESGAFKRALYQVNGIVESRLHMGVFGLHTDTPQTLYESDSGLNITVTMDTATGVLFVNAVGLASRALRWSARLEFLPEV